MGIERTRKHEEVTWRALVIQQYGQTMTMNQKPHLNTCTIFFCYVEFIFARKAHNSLSIDRHKENKNARENLVSVAYYLSCALHTRPYIVSSS